MSNSMFYTGLSGLSVAQAALVTTGHNTANVNTPGYSRQTAQTASNTGLYAPGVGFFGTGARTTDVTRSYDQFLATQLNQAQSTNQSLTTQFTQISQIDNLLADQTAGLAPMMQALFAGVQVVANAPADPAARQQLISSGQAMTNQFRAMSQYLTGLNSNVNDQIAGNVEQINVYSGQIAHLNKQIALLSNATGSQAPNDLLDQRDQLVSGLSKLVGTKVVVQDGGQYNIFVGNGQTLVLGDKATTLKAVSSAADPSQNAVAMLGASGVAVELQDSVLAGGALGGLLQFRNETLSNAQNSLGRIAIAMSDTFNAQQKLGFDLNGDTGQDFFSQASPGIIKNGRNTGGLVMTPSFADSGQLTTSDYRLNVTAGPGYSLTRLSDNVEIGTYADTDFPITFDGVTLAADNTIPAQAGDSFLIQPTRSGARDFAVLMTDQAKVAAASASFASATGGVSDGSNALLLGALQNKKTIGGGASSFNDAYAQLVSTVGNKAQQIQISNTAQTSLTAQIRSAQQSVSGVNQDEETANLLMFQQMYQANAKVIQTASTMFDAVLGIR